MFGYISHDYYPVLRQDRGFIPVIAIKGISRSA
jgi:hypothetical protein